jgi:5,10-methylenetetrahydromethanopterin reductase
VSTLRTGVWLFPSEPAARLIAVAEQAERLGLDELWLGDEGPARDPFALLAAIAMRTDRLQLGIAVTNPYLRHPAVAASSAVTVQELAAGRVALGFGIGGGWALDPVQIERKRPFEDAERAVRIARGVSERQDTEGYAPPAHAVGPVPLPLFVGSRGERLNRFASRFADGAFVGGVPIGLLDRVLGWARSERPIEVALCLNVAFEDDDRERARPEIVRVLLDSPAHVREHLGLESSQLRAAAAALDAGDDGPARAVITDAVLDEYVLQGDEDEDEVAAAVAGITARRGATQRARAERRPRPRRRRTAPAAAVPDLGAAAGRGRWRRRAGA